MYQKRHRERSVAIQMAVIWIAASALPPRNDKIVVRHYPLYAGNLCLPDSGLYGQSPSFSCSEAAL